MELNRVRHHGISASQNHDSNTVYEMTSKRFSDRIKLGQLKQKQKNQQTPAEKPPNSVLYHMKQE